MGFINKHSLTEHQLAERWNLSVKTLQYWRRTGIGVSYLKLGKTVRYPHEIVEKYEADHMRKIVVSTPVLEELK